MHSRNLSYFHFFNRESLLSTMDDEKPSTPNKRKPSHTTTSLQKRRKYCRPSNMSVLRERAAQKIQRWWMAMCTKRKQQKYMNDTDFLSLEPFGRRDIIFCLVEESRHVYRFIPVNLAQWFLKEGKFINPYTRTPLNIVELRRLDRLLQKHTNVSICLSEKYMEIQRSRRREYEHDETCRMLHDESIAHISRVVQTIIRSTYQSEEHQQTVLEEFNVYCQTVHQLMAIDNLFTLASLQFAKKMIRYILYDDVILSTCNCEQFNMLEFIKINIENLQTQIIQDFMRSEAINSLLRSLTSRPASAPTSAPEPAPEPASESASESSSESAPEPAPEPASESVSESAPEPASEPAPEPASEPAPEPASAHDITRVIEALSSPPSIPESNPLIMYMLEPHEMSPPPSVIPISEPRVISVSLVSPSYPTFMGISFENSESKESPNDTEEVNFFIRDDEDNGDQVPFANVLDSSEYQLIQTIYDAAGIRRNPGNN